MSLTPYTSCTPSGGLFLWLSNFLPYPTQDLHRMALEKPASISVCNFRAHLTALDLLLLLPLPIVPFTQSNCPPIYLIPHHQAPSHCLTHFKCCSGRKSKTDAMIASSRHGCVAHMYRGSIGNVVEDVPNAIECLSSPRSAARVNFIIERADRAERSQEIIMLG